MCEGVMLRFRDGLFLIYRNVRNGSERAIEEMLVSAKLINLTRDAKIVVIKSIIPRLNLTTLFPEKEELLAL